MKVKTYRAATMKAALEQIKRELGADAFILSQKQIRPKSFLGLVQKNLVEVTAAIDRSRVPEPAKPSLPVRSAPQETAVTGLDLKPQETDDVPDRVQIHSQPRHESSQQIVQDNRDLLDEIRKLKELVQSITPERGRTAVWLKAQSFPSSACESLYTDLVTVGIGEDLAFSLTSLADASRETVSNALANRITVYPEFVSGSTTRRPETLALLGPTGVGKTTTLAKIAALAAFQNNLKVGLVTLDTFRIAAIEQLKTYAEIMGIPVRAVESVKEFGSATQSLSDRDLILIDTAGRNPRDANREGELAEFLAESAGIKKALVLSATTKPSDLADIVERHQVFKPDCLIFTKLDETDTHGPIISEVLRCGLPLAYVTTGQGVPHDILRPDARQLVELAISSNRSEVWNEMIQATLGTRPLHSSEPTNATRRLSY
jgi:flagellar biosynthesis protein FlhF